MLKLVVFVVLSAGLIYISRASLRAPRSHGFYRFFAWECILALFLLNVDTWFRDPFSWHQLVSWFLLIICIVPLAFGVHSLVTRGKPVKSREDDAQLVAFEKTSTLVTTGIYHSLYSPPTLQFPPAIGLGDILQSTSLVKCTTGCGSYLALTRHGQGRRG